MEYYLNLREKYKLETKNIRVIFFLTAIFKIFNKLFSSSDVPSLENFGC